jgi:hypothetical protein
VQRSGGPVRGEAWRSSHLLQAAGTVRVAGPGTWDTNKNKRQPLFIVHPWCRHLTSRPPWVPGGKRSPPLQGGANLSPICLQAGSCPKGYLVTSFLGEGAIRTDPQTTTPQICRRATMVGRGLSALGQCPGAGISNSKSTSICATHLSILKARSPAPSAPQ